MTRCGSPVQAANVLRDAVYGFLPSVALCLDGDLALMLERPSRHDAYCTHFIGEALVRRWLYGDAMPAGLLTGLVGALRECGTSPEALDAFDMRFPCRQKERPCDSAVDDRLRGVLDYVRTRIEGYLASSGFVAVVGPSCAGEEEAIVLPFILEPVGDYAPQRVCDWDENPIPGWSGTDVLRHLNLCAADLVLCCRCGKARAQTLCGRSFGLPVAVAALQQAGRMDAFDRFSVLTSGAFDGAGKLCRVDGLAAKRALARRLGARVFVCPAESGEAGRDDGVVALPVGLSAQECGEALERALSEHGITAPTPGRLRGRIEKLEDEVRAGAIHPEHELARIERLFSQFGELGAEAAADVDEFEMRCWMMRNALYNHAGQPAAARVAYKRAMALYGTVGGAPEKKFRARADHVVTLVDLGELDDAEAYARDLLTESERFCEAELHVRRDIAMRAHGVLGGQVLLNRALADASKDAALEAKWHLEAALRNARETGSPREIAFDLCQIGLWEALFNEETALEAIDRLREEIVALKVSEVSSLEYLRSHRLLAAYRMFLRGRAVVSDAADAPLPGERAPDWVRMLSRKYHATLLAAAGSGDEARSLFMSMAETGRRLASRSQLFLFLHAAGQLQAGEAMLAADAKFAQEALQDASEGFRRVQGAFGGVQNDSGWLARAEGLLQGLPGMELPDLRLRIRY